MKKIFSIISTALASLFISISCNAQEKIKLPNPPEVGDMTLVEALWNRHSTWNHTDKPISEEELSQVLWAATGINRPESGRITAPSAINAQDIMVYVCREDGTYLYNKNDHSLDKVNDRDIRKYVAGPDSRAEKAPVMLLLVSDLTKFGGNDEFNRMMGAMDTGYVSENICLMCTAIGLNTVPRITMDDEELINILNLNPNQVPMLNHPISKP